MYRSKSEYDTAVVDTQAHRPVSVKRKQFSLRGARILNDQNDQNEPLEPQTLKYVKCSQWKYIVVEPACGNPIKISEVWRDDLKIVHERIRRILA